MPDLLFFICQWKIERIIDNRRAGTSGRFVGKATFEQQTHDHADYHEEGAFWLEPHPSIRAQQHYRWYQRPNNMDVHFSDGRFFHRISRDSTTPEAVHLCGDDRYWVRYDFSHSHAWSTVWHVEGPQKDYRLITTYTPVLYPSVPT